MAKDKEALKQLDEVMANLSLDVLKLEDTLSKSSIPSKKKFCLSFKQR
jgi:hypothetical protein